MLSKHTDIPEEKLTAFLKEFRRCSRLHPGLTLVELRDGQDCLRIRL